MRLLPPPSTVPSNILPRPFNCPLAACHLTLVQCPTEHRPPMPSSTPRCRDWPASQSILRACATAGSSSRQARHACQFLSTSQALGTPASHLAYAPLFAPGGACVHRARSCMCSSHSCAWLRTTSRPSTQLQGSSPRTPLSRSVKRWTTRRASQSTTCCGRSTGLLTSYSDFLPYFL